MVLMEMFAAAAGGSNLLLLYIETAASLSDSKKTIYQI
jgi:hypothetical protein